FFFSSRRRHTRWPRDWSSDVCSSDLTTNAAALDATVVADRAALDNAKVQLEYATITAPIAGRTGALMVHAGNLVRANDTNALVRSEERRVGKECRGRWGP